MGKSITVWFDKEGDYLEVMFEQKAGYFRETDHEAMLEKVDKEGQTVGFSVLGVSQLRQQPNLSTSIAVLVNLAYSQELLRLNEPLTLTQFLESLSLTTSVPAAVTHPPPAR